MPIIGNPASGGKKPTTPTIGTATDGGTGTTVSVAFTPSTYIGKGSITYTALSNPGSISATGSGSPITVSGLTTGTAYTFTVKGDTNYGVASDTSSASNSVTPVTPTAFDSIATQTLGSAAGSVTFSSIPNTYKSLQIRLLATTSVVNQNIYLRLNSDSGSNYSEHWLAANSSGGGLANYNTSTDHIRVFGAVGGTATATYYAAVIIDLIDYASTAKNKTVRSLAGINSNTNFTAGNSTDIDLHSGLWMSTTAVNSITLYPSSGNFNSTSTFALYGIK